jgi:hypothetical protein
MSDLLKHSHFLQQVESYVTEHPTVAPYVTQFVAQGIENSRQLLIEQAGDMESALAQSLFRRFRKGKLKNMTEEDVFVVEKIKKWKEKGRCFINWDWLLDVVNKKEVADK